MTANVWRWAVRLRWLGMVVFAAAWPAAMPLAQDATRPTANMAPGDPPGEWRSQARDWANTRYSSLTDISSANASRLKVAWTFSDGTQNGHEAAPLVQGDTMYLVTPFPNIAYALDLTKPGAPIKWSFAPNPSPVSIGKACCDTVNRGGALPLSPSVAAVRTLHGRGVHPQRRDACPVPAAAAGERPAGPRLGTGR